mgnify:CR=1 FL=1
MEDLRVEDLMDDINTDAMTPAWACFDYRPEDIARNAYAGITVGKERLFPEGALMAGNFEVIVSGYRKGVGSIARDGGAGREVVGHPASPSPPRSRPSTRATTSPGRAHGRPRDACGGCRRARRCRSRSSPRATTPSRSMIIEHGGLFPFTEGLPRGARCACPRRHTGRGP